MSEGEPASSEALSFSLEAEVNDRLYYQDPDCLSFTGRLVQQEPVSGRWGIVLDKTAFYPEGGGHPPDRGTLNGIPVLDVQELEGRVVHFLPEPLADPAREAPEPLPVAGAVEAGHRREYRQQHTGQHIVSASLAESAGALTVSAHLGERYTSVEVDRDCLEEAELEAAESLANRIVTRNLPVRVLWARREELDRYRLRKAPPPEIGLLRIVEIPGHDASPCGGLHVGSTGEVGLIQLTGVEKIRGHLRLSWRIGERAYREAREMERLAQELGRELGCRREELPVCVRELKARLRARELEASQLKRRLGELLAAGLRERGRHLGGITLVVQQLDGQSQELVEEIFRALVSTPGTVAALACREAGALRWLAGCSQELELDLQALVVPHLQLIGGRGGGRGKRWQGVGARPEGAGRFLSALAASLGAAVRQP